MSSEMIGEPGSEDMRRAAQSPSTVKQVLTENRNYLNKSRKTTSPSITTSMIDHVSDIVKENTKPGVKLTTSRTILATGAGGTYVPGGRLFVIEGNIGVGKTTLASTLSSKMSCKVFVEPATENPYLQKFYEDPHKYALQLQLWILQQRYRTYVEATNHVLSTGKNVILDRSVYSDIVFAKVCHNEGYITEEGYQKYLYWREKALNHLPLPHITLFLNANPSCCLERIKKRGRDCEGGVPLDYLTKLHDEYSVFCEDIQKQGSDILKFSWQNFPCSTQVENEILKQDVSDWSKVAIDSYMQRHSRGMELSELQSMLAE